MVEIVSGYKIDNTTLTLGTDNIIGINLTNLNTWTTPQIFASSPNYLSIPITNNQSVATPAPFQQMIQLNLSQYIQLKGIASDLSNIYFSSDVAGQNKLYSWRETPASLTTTQTWWVLLPDGIPANSTITIYLQVSSSPELDGNYTGEAPQLSPTYGQYDNGANVFPFYDNFAGTSLNTTKWGTYLSSGTSYTVNNGFSSETATWGFVMSKTAYNPQQYIADAYGYATSTATEQGGNWGWVGNQDSAGAGSTQQYFVNTYNNAYYSGIWTGSGGNWYELSNLGTGSTTSDFVMSVYTTTSAVVASINYGSWISNSADFVASTGLSAGFQWGNGPTLYVQWFRLRAIPPNGVMPSVSFGGVSS